jgi:hypothetical protein
MMPMRRLLPLGWALSVLLSAAAPVAARSLASFGRCLDREGATFYGTSWCPHCNAQREMLGAGMRYVHYVECSVGGERRSTEACRDAGARSYPTWEFADGSRAHGRLSLQQLAERTGCTLD